MNKIISKIKNQPQEYIDIISLKRLLSFLNGYECALRKHCVGFDGKCSLINFYLFLAHTKKIPSEHNLESYCLSKNISDFDGYYLFFELYEIYVNELQQEVIKNNSCKKSNTSLRMTNEYVLQLLNDIEEKPKMFLGKKELTRFYYFIKGFISVDDKNAYFDLYFTDFTLFLQNRFLNEETNWYNIISENSKDEESGFDLFFELFNSYLKLKN